MSKTSLRLTPPDGHMFTGHAIDRNKRIGFTFEGRRMTGFAGDTILSALLAAGIDDAYMLSGSPIRLWGQSELAVFPAGRGHDIAGALPIGRTEITEGAAYSVSGAAVPGAIAGWLGRVAKGNTPPFGIARDAAELPTATYSDMQAESIDTADVVVVGGGIAGLAAAARAVERGQRVLLVERRAYLGGDAMLFGNAAGEEAPEKTIARLVEGLEGSETCTVLVNTNALDLRGGRLLVHQIETGSGQPVPRLLTVKARRTVLATGSADRLPVFAGNRLPGVIPLASVFHLAAGYGVWPGTNAVIATATNAAYRLALLAHDGGMPPARLIDSRLNPQSRFIEFAKAYGIVSASSLRLASVAANRGARQLAVNTELSVEGGTGDFAPLAAGCVIVSGGWTPRLTLWLSAGGTVGADKDGNLSAGRGPKGIALAGGCAGMIGNSAIAQSGVAAVDRVFGRRGKKIADTMIDPAFESPDGNLPVSTSWQAQTGAPAYLSGSDRPVSAYSRAPDRRGGRQRLHDADEAEAIAEHAFGLADLAAMVAAGLLDASQFSAIARERAIVATTFTESKAQEPPPAPSRSSALPAYLAGRFGTDAEIREISGAAGRLEVGNLILASSDITDAAAAFGVIVRGAANGGPALALLRRDAAPAGSSVSVRGAHGAANALVGATVDQA